MTAEPSNWNVPNALTTLRLLMVPFFGWALLVDGGNDDTWRWVAWVIFGLAMVTDKIDGDLARKHDLITNFGKIADPIADKALTGMAFVGLSLVGELWWAVTVVVLVREWGITLMRFWLIKHDVIVPASQGGKVKTAVQALALSLLTAPLLNLTTPLDEVAGFGDLVATCLYVVGVASMAVAVAVTVWTGVQYVGAMLAARRLAKAGKPAGAV